MGQGLVGAKFLRYIFYKIHLKALTSKIISWLKLKYTKLKVKKTVY